MLETIGHPPLVWTLTPRDMTLSSSSAVGGGALASYHPHSRVSPLGVIEPVLKKKGKEVVRDWLEINMLGYETESLPIHELLVDFLLLDHLRHLYFLIPTTPTTSSPPRPAVTTPTKVQTTSPTTSVTNNSPSIVSSHSSSPPAPTIVVSHSESLHKRIRQAVF